MSLNSLPPELKRRIAEETGEYKTTANVSKEWRDIVNTSKKLMQSELDKYFFFFYIWYDYDVFKKPAHPFPSYWREKRYPVKFVFPIATEEQFIVLKKLGNSKNSQVAAIAKNGDLKKWFSDAFIFMPSLSDEMKLIEHDIYKLNLWQRQVKFPMGDTESLIERIKTNQACKRRVCLSAKDPIYQYLRKIMHGIDSLFFFGPSSEAFKHFFGVFDVFKIKVKFSYIFDMEKLLRDEHKVLRDGSDLYFVKPRHYNILEEFSIKYRVNHFPPVLTSLIIPRWGTELKTLAKLKTLHYYARTLDEKEEEVYSIENLFTA